MKFNERAAKILPALRFILYCTFKNAIFTFSSGIALSEAEASVAAPFTSKVFDISCVPRLVREGRAALVTSFSIFKYIALYSFIQFFGVLILFYDQTSYGDWSFFVADLILAFFFALAITQSRTSKRLARRRPPGRLSDPRTIANIFLQLLALLCFQIAGFIVARDHNDHYKRPDQLGEADFGFYRVSYEGYAVVIINFFQYIWTVFPSYTSEPYLVPLYKNNWFVVVFLVNLVLVIFVTFLPAQFVATILEFPPVVPTRLSWILLALGFGNLVVLLGIDWLTRRYKVSKKFTSLFGGKKEASDYKVVFRQLLKKDWVSISLQSSKIE